MSRALIRSAVLASVTGLLGLAGLTGPASASPMPVGAVTAGAASTATTIAGVQPATSAAGVVPQVNLFWFTCENASTRTEYMYLQTGLAFCGDGAWGFAALTTNSGTSHTVEVCDYVGPSYTEEVNPANP